MTKAKVFTSRGNPVPMGSYKKAKPNWRALDLCPLRIRRSAPSTEQLWKMTQSAAATSGQRLGSDLHWNLPQRILCFAAQCAVHTTFQNRHCKNFVSQPFVWGRWEHCRQCPSQLISVFGFINCVQLSPDKCKRQSRKITLGCFLPIRSIALVFFFYL